MSSIGSDPHLGLAGLDRLGGRIALDDAQRQPGGTEPLREAAPLAEAGAPSVPDVDIGERVLTAAAWTEVPAGERLLSGDLAFEHALAGQDLSAAADSALDAILSALAS